jgi:hypothetical protein
MIDASIFVADLDVAHNLLTVGLLYWLTTVGVRNALFDLFVVLGFYTAATAIVTLGANFILGRPEIHVDQEIVVWYGNYLVRASVFLASYARLTRWTLAPAGKDVR